MTKAKIATRVNSIAKAIIELELAVDSAETPTEKRLVALHVIRACDSALVNEHAFVRTTLDRIAIHFERKALA